MKIKEEYAIAEDRDDFIKLDRKYKGLTYKMTDLNAFFIWFDQKAPLKLRLEVRQSLNEKHSDIRKSSKNKEV